MKKLMIALVAATVAGLGILADSTIASAGGYCAYGDSSGVCVTPAGRPGPHMGRGYHGGHAYAGERRYVRKTVRHTRTVERRRHYAPAAAAPAYIPGQKCLPGYQWYKDKGECTKLYDQPSLAEKVACTPGEQRSVPDPKRPGFTKLQVCGFGGGVAIKQ